MYHIAKKNFKATAKVILKCKICDKELHSFHNFRENKRKEHGAQRSSGDQSVDVAQLMADVDDNSLKEKLETWKHFLVDSGKENGRHTVYNFAMDSLESEYSLEKLDVVFDSLKCAAKVNVAVGFVLKDVEDWSCRYYYAHENNTLSERSKLVATTQHLTKIKNLLNNTGIIAS